MENEEPFFKEIQTLGIEYDKDASDLYVPVNETTLGLLVKYNLDIEPFIALDDGTHMYNVAFAYQTEWLINR